jgi:cytochrome oxidase Cu insertion factor (SCO1/SenC/PrrC family)
MVFSAEVPAQTSFPKRCTTNRPAIGGPFKLYDTEKNEVTESKLRGNWALMYFGYTSCPDVGPAEVQKMADVVKLLGTYFLEDYVLNFLSTLCIYFYTFCDYQLM